MNNEQHFKIRTDWSAWPEDLDAVAESGFLDPMAHNDPQESIFHLLRTVPTVAGQAPSSIKDGSRMDEDRNAAPDLLNLPMMCHTYLAGSADYLKGLYRVMRPLPRV